MTTAFPLQPALDVAERRAEAKSRAVKLAYVAWLNARTHQVRLEQRRHHYAGELNAKLRQGCSAAVAQAAGGALRQWQADVLAAARQLDNARHEWQLALDAWQVEKKRVEALQLLARRHALEQQKIEEKRERRLHDELSTRSAYALRFAEQEETALPHSHAGLTR
jgi:flagellar export protein FliJ